MKMLFLVVIRLLYHTQAKVLFFPMVWWEYNIIIFTTLQEYNFLLKVNNIVEYSQPLRTIDNFIYWYDVSPLKPGSFFRTIFGSVAVVVTKDRWEKITVEDR